MNIGSVNSTQMQQMQMNGSSRSNVMSTEQKEYVQDLLSDYDANSLTEDDAKEIVDALQEAGIEPSKSLASTMATSGFDAKEIGDMAGVGKGAEQGQRPMGPPPPKQEEMSSVSDLLESLLSSDEEEDSDSASSFDTILDYTSKIVSLKDDAKTDVMDLLNKYNSDENTLSQEDTQKFIMNSLSQILKESDNYNTMSFYA